MGIERDRGNTTRAESLPQEELVPMSRFVAGACRATIALLRFCAAVAREPSLDPALLEPRSLRGA